jgi:hypothetical protein
MRYELRYGKFGPYFFDTKTNRDMGLYDVLLELNQEEDGGHYAPTNFLTRAAIAEKYHEFCKQMVNQQIGMITKPTQPYIEWKDLTSDQKEGRFFVAEKIMTEILGLNYPENAAYWANWKPSK